ncbi:MAG: outer membrane lipoprotein-sorting protein [Spirochaetales bacterium]
MKDMLKRGMLVMGITLIAAGAAGAQSIDTTGFLEQMDENLLLEDTDFSAVTTFVSEDPEDGVDRQKARMFRRDRDGAFVVLILEPQANRGQGYLQVEDGLWFYDPESRSFSFTDASESFQGTDARVSDFGSASLSEDYEIVGAEQGRLGDFDVYVLDLEATNSEVTYPSRRVWVTQEQLLTLKSEDYSVTDRLLRTSYFPNYTRIAGAYMATRVILEDELVEGRKTTITFEDISAADLPDNVFTKSYVERVSR